MYEENDKKKDKDETFKARVNAKNATERDNRSVSRTPCSVVIALLNPRNPGALELSSVVFSPNCKNVVL